MHDSSPRARPKSPVLSPPAGHGARPKPPGGSRRAPAARLQAKRRSLSNLSGVASLFRLLPRALHL
eukprot:4597827-Lingulodinium_polyedra.AAC.1